MDEPSSFATKTWRSRGSAVDARNQTVARLLVDGPRAVHHPRALRDRVLHGPVGGVAIEVEEAAPLREEDERAVLQEMRRSDRVDPRGVALLEELLRRAARPREEEDAEVRLRPVEERGSRRSFRPASTSSRGRRRRRPATARTRPSRCPARSTTWTDGDGVRIAGLRVALRLELPVHGRVVDDRVGRDARLVEREVRDRGRVGRPEERALAARGRRAPRRTPSRASPFSTASEPVFVRRVSLPVAASATQRSCFFTYARRVPSGDHAGSDSSSASSVRRLAGPLAARRHEPEVVVEGDGEARRPSAQNAAPRRESFFSLPSRAFTAGASRSFAFFPVAASACQSAAGASGPPASDPHDARRVAPRVARRACASRRPSRA